MAAPPLPLPPPPPPPPPPPSPHTPHHRDMLQAIMWYKFATMAGSSEALSIMAKLCVGGETHVEGDENLDNSGNASYYGFGDPTCFHVVYFSAVRPDIEKEICADIEQKYPNQDKDKYDAFEEDWSQLESFSPYEIRLCDLPGEWRSQEACGCGATGCCRGMYQYEVWHKGCWREGDKGDEVYGGHFVGPEKLLWKGAYHIIETGPMQERVHIFPPHPTHLITMERVEMLQPTTDCHDRPPNHHLIANAEAKYASEKRRVRDMNQGIWDPEADMFVEPEYENGEMDF